MDRPIRHCGYCKHCRPLTQPFQLTDQLGREYMQTKLFDDYGQTDWCVCTEGCNGGKPYYYGGVTRCEFSYEPREITEADIACWGKILPLKWKDLMENRHCVLQVTATEDTLEVRYKFGNRDKHAFFKVGEAVESTGDLFSTISTDRYNLAMTKVHMPSERSYWSYGKSDKEISMATYGYLGGVL